MNFGLDLRPSLSRPTGVGAYVLALARRLPLHAPDDRFYYLSASLRERYPPTAWPANVRFVDRRLPVHLLNLLWNRAGWPALDTLVGASLDLVHSPHPLIVPGKRAKHVITIHDLFFLKHPELTDAEIRRDYVPLVRQSVRRASGDCSAGGRFLPRRSPRSERSKPRRENSIRQPTGCRAAAADRRWGRWTRTAEQTPMRMIERVCAIFLRLAGAWVAPTWRYGGPHFYFARKEATRERIDRLENELSAAHRRLDELATLAADVSLATAEAARALARATTAAASSPTTSRAACSSATRSRRSTRTASAT